MLFIITIILMIASVVLFILGFKFSSITLTIIGIFTPLLILIGLMAILAYRKSDIISSTDETETYELLKITDDQYYIYLSESEVKYAIINSETGEKEVINSYVDTYLSNEVTIPTIVETYRTNTYGSFYIPWKQEPSQVLFERKLLIPDVNPSTEQKTESW